MEHGPQREQAYRRRNFHQVEHNTPWRETFRAFDFAIFESHYPVSRPAFAQHATRRGGWDGYYFTGGSAGVAEEDAVGNGAPLPAVPDPKPSLLRVAASIFPVGLMPFLS